METDNGEALDPNTYYARPGFIRLDSGALTRIKTMGDGAERYDRQDKKWVPFGDHVKLMHGERLTEDEARKLAKEKGIPLDDL